MGLAAVCCGQGFCGRVCCGRVWCGHNRCGGTTVAGSILAQLARAWRTALFLTSLWLVVSNSLTRRGAFCGALGARGVGTWALWVCDVGTVSLWARGVGCPGSVWSRFLAGAGGIILKGSIFNFFASLDLGVPFSFLTEPFWDVHLLMLEMLHSYTASKRCH